MNWGLFAECLVIGINISLVVMMAYERGYNFGVNKVADMVFKVADDMKAVGE